LSAPNVPLRPLGNLTDAILAGERDSDAVFSWEKGDHTWLYPRHGTPRCPGTSRTGTSTTSRPGRDTASPGISSGSWALVILAVSLIDANAFNACSGTFQILAFGGMWRRFRAESIAVRLVPFVCVMAAGVVTACLGYRSLVTNMTNFLDVRWSS